MNAIKSMTVADVEREFLGPAGFQFKRQTGSHRIYYDGAGHRCGLVATAGAITPGHIDDLCHQLRRMGVSVGRFQADNNRRVRKEQARMVALENGSIPFDRISLDEWERLKAEHPGKKRCPVCFQWKPATAEVFGQNRGAADGLQGYCKACQKEKREEKAKRTPTPTTAGTGPAPLATVEAPKPQGWAFAEWARKQDAERQAEAIAASSRPRATTSSCCGYATRAARSALQWPGATF